jgi:endonuclease YncB( thermonuclease family)
VISVTDGDTLTVQGTGTTSSVVRLAEIDAPEKCQPYGPAARDSLISLALNRTVTLVRTDTDRYGRVVGKVTVAGESQTLNRVLLSQGLAWVYDAYVQDMSLHAVEAEARNARHGLWADAAAVAPWDWRSRETGCSRDPEGTSITTLAVNLPRVVEFWNSTTNHYFMTSNAAEANGIDGGSAGPGWQRTGNTFSVWPAESAEAGTAPVCRFYAHGPNSHFFTANAAECQWLRDLEAQQRREASSVGKPFLGWGYEGTAFRIKLPNDAGQCPSGSEEIYRAYNMRHDFNDQNHRFSPWLTDIQKLAGWKTEGVAMCSPR